jgi:enamine deaminase RidA (YjgF/YER057c/UK114 family)
VTTPEEKLAQLGLELPPPPKAMAAYVPVVRTGNLVFVAGQGPFLAGQPSITGKVPEQVSVEEAQKAARDCCLNGLAAIKAEIGSLEAIVRMVKLTVFVASGPGFGDQPKVANGASELLEQVLGDAGKHARAAVGVAELPFNIPVEVDFVAEVRASA